ncbi:MAG: hypothetical protein ACM3PZ_00115 [Bacillota bacterium]
MQTLIAKKLTLKGKKETLELAGKVADHYFKKFSTKLFDEEETENDQSEFMNLLKSGKDIVLLDPILSDSERTEINSLTDKAFIGLLREVSLNFLRMDKSLSSHLR